MNGKDDVWQLDIELGEEGAGSDDLDSTVLKMVSEQIEQLPPFPLVINHVLRIIEDPKASLADISRLILTDPSLTAKILQIINSAYYGFSGSVSTVSHAVALLGSREVKSLALGLPINEACFSRKRSFGLKQTDLWEHSLGVGICGRKIGEKVGYPLLEEAFIGGLLHDIGKNVLNDVFPERFDQALRKAELENLSLLEVEKEMLTISHDTIGFWVAQHWQLPSTLTSAIQNHHQPLRTAPTDEQKGIRLEAIIFLGDFLAKFLRIGFSGDNCLPLIKTEVIQHLSLTPESVIAIADSVQAGIQPMLRPFGIQIEVNPLTDEDRQRITELMPQPPQD